MANLTVEASPHVAEHVSLAPDRTTRWLVIAAVAALLPFFIGVTTTRSITIDGVTTTVVRNWVAIGGGVVAMFFGLVAALQLRSRSYLMYGTARWVIAVLAILVGLRQLLHGIGMA